MDPLYAKLTDAIEKSNKSYDLERIKAAYTMARQAHEGQMRSSGDPYISHPIEVAIILVGLGMDSDTIIGGILHDVVEDTSITLEDIQKRFGGDVADLVDGVTKLANIPYSSRAEQQAENVRKMLLAMAKDVRVVIIKLADRLHNMRTLDYRTPEKQRVKSLETMEIYAPLAHRLGIRSVKEELEDLSLKHLDPVAYHEIEQQLALRKEDREAFLGNIIKRIEARLEEEHVTAQIDGRVKSIYGIYRKMYIQGRSFDEIYDIYAVRIIVDTVLECYNILGIIHDMLRPIPNRFKDYISTPKQNMYQSLHTTVLDKEGVPFEVQIRTWDMHYTAEYGVAAHWKYKIGMEGKDALDERLAWIRQLLESQQESEDVEDIVKSIKTDIAPEEVFVFTPRGDVIRLPQGSTVIDFAYAIHTEVGNKMIGAKVDGRMVSLDYKVKTGMIVEIITSTTQSNGPSRDWLKIVKTSEARNKIRSWFKKEKREENIAEGKLALEKEMRRNLIAPPAEEREKFIADIAARQKYNTVDDFYASIGYGGVSLEKIIPRIKDDFIRLYRKPGAQTLVPTKKVSQKASNGVIVEGLEGCLIKFARCCNPLPGDEIVGFITRGFGVSIHKCDCANVVNAKRRGEDPERWVKATWASRVKETFKSTLDILASDRIGILADVSVQLGNMRIPVHSVMAKELKTGQTSIQVSIGINDLNQLQTIINNLSRIQGVVSVKRAVLS
ncbi:MAG: bifunctional (p)ppGpp synthetase/guanosine-3',5'-bis(diphosphate) 3'-pyrophosphohydrolase [Angelakisella sp.]|nr:bifunctional (p)ppGpp synthetase/guanosine-3',5'-bis(diphosphate) 3'-pyrophosphohydrolase [Angelakisella sp.]